MTSPMRFFGYIDPQRMCAALMYAGFRDVPIPGLTQTDIAGRKWTDMHEVTYACAIALAESSGNLFAVHENTNGSVDESWLQINNVHADIESPLCSPWTLVGGAQLAWQIYNDPAHPKSFDPWNCTKVQPGRQVAEVWDWYNESIGLTRMKYASDGIALLRTTIKNGQDAGLDMPTILNRAMRFDLRDFSPYQH